MLHSPLAIHRFTSQLGFKHIHRPSERILRLCRNVGSASTGLQLTRAMNTGDAYGEPGGAIAKLFQPATMASSTKPPEHVHLTGPSTNTPCAPLQLLFPVQLVEVHDAQPDVPKIHLKPVKLAELEVLPTETFVDVVAVLDSCQDLGLIQRRDGSEGKKRSMVVRDDSGRSIELTLWGEKAETVGAEIFEHSRAGNHPVLVIKSAPQLPLCRRCGRCIGPVRSVRQFLTPGLLGCSCFHACIRVHCGGLQCYWNHVCCLARKCMVFLYHIQGRPLCLVVAW